MNCDLKTKDPEGIGLGCVCLVLPGDFLTGELVSDIVKNLYANVKSE
jgi:hypothetical protein